MMVFDVDTKGGLVISGANISNALQDYSTTPGSRMRHIYVSSVLPLMYLRASAMAK
jgi:hypothetical protein